MRTKTWKRFVSFACVMAFGASLAVQAGPKDDHVTVGWFLQEVAAARHVTIAPGGDPAIALRAAGINVPALPSSRTLTEADVVAVSRALGVRVSSTNPAAPFTRTQAQAFVGSIVADPGGDGSAQPQDIGGVPNDSSENGKGKKKGHNKSSSEPL